ncbi:hypothetical protein Cycma_1709 [Cyclobacterium marinum DSM 745]|uniref:Uncharacterized protein n=1 Tax=Cyclobacterium marinum (strain ATCC 25205 / DSM 745 / LMG 13164 / NCIMB 1802) TaxID=880070 RepID=G0IUS1_CYCMS|nr:hypothetical protein Cycma_1709 [Cyclobacterium marinum DSM 745]
MRVVLPKNKTYIVCQSSLNPQNLVISLVVVSFVMIIVLSKNLIIFTIGNIKNYGKSI